MACKQRSTKFLYTSSLEVGERWGTSGSAMFNQAVEVGTETESAGPVQR